MTHKRSILNRAATEPAASPAWVVTYADLVTLLLCVFVGLFSMSAIRPDRFQTALGSLQATFGSKEPRSKSAEGDESLFGKLQRSVVEPGENALPTERGPGDSWLTISRTATGVRLTLAGPTTFERGHAELGDKARGALNRIASVVSGSSGVIIISGHSAGERAAGDGDPRDLSYERAARVARRLEEAGIAKVRMQVVALGEDHPALDHAYTEKRRAMNRRVEIEIVESGATGVAAE